MMAIVMPKEIIEKPIENVFNHEEFGFVSFITEILPHFFRRFTSEESRSLPRHLPGGTKSLLGGVF